GHAPARNTPLHPHRAPTGAAGRRRHPVPPGRLAVRASPGVPGPHHPLPRGKTARGRHPVPHGTLAPGALVPHQSDGHRRGGGTRVHRRRAPATGKRTVVVTGGGLPSPVLGLSGPHRHVRHLVLRLRDLLLCVSTRVIGPVPDVPGTPPGL